MKRILPALLCAALTLTLASCAQSPPPRDVQSPPPQDIQTPAPRDVQPAEIQAIGIDETGKAMQRRSLNPVAAETVTSLREFSAELAALTLTKKENQCVSPISLYLALAMAAQGARDSTRAELLNAMRVPDTLAGRLPEQAGNLMRRLYTDNDAGVLKVANSAWIQNGYDLEDAYLDSLSGEYYAALYNVDFNDADTGKQIGRWIADNTGGLLTPEPEYDKATVLTLINTIYLKDAWRNIFRMTQLDDFTRADGSVVSCTFMLRGATNGHELRRFGEGYAAAAIPTQNGVSMALILPDEGLSPWDLLSKPEIVAEWLDLSGYRGGAVLYTVPQFSFGAKPDVLNAVQNMGVKAAFDARTADLTGIYNDPGQPLFIGDIRQETHIGIDENGVEAAAYTEIIAFAGAMPMEPDDELDLKLDRPFAFALISDTGVPLFVGVVEDPTAD